MVGVPFLRIHREDCLGAGARQVSSCQLEVSTKETHSHVALVINIPVTVGNSIIIVLLKKKTPNFLPATLIKRHKT